MVTRRSDPRFGQVAGHIPKELLTRLKVFVAQSDLNLSESLEVAIILLLREVELGHDLPCPTETEDRRFKDQRGE